MKKIYVYILLIILTITLIIINKENKNKIFKVDRIKYFASLDGDSINFFPEKGSYGVSVDCINAKGIWNYKDWTMDIYSITGKVSCNISFGSKTYFRINDYIKNLGSLVNENGYRYEGKNPRNYIYFNNELWRIIGVFDETSHGKTGEYLTKIIRNDSIGGYAWNKTNTNNWSTSSLYKLLNTNYYTATDGTNSGNCYRYSTTITGNCDYTVTGIQSDYRLMVENVTWYLGGFKEQEDVEGTVEAFYKGERDSTSVYNGNNSTITGYIGLMYASDYGYSVFSSACARTTTLSSYGTSSCGGSSWLNKGGGELTITHYPTSSSYLYYITNRATIGNIYSNYGNATRPVLYLKSDVQVYAGDGSITNPYQIMLPS